MLTRRNLLGSLGGLPFLRFLKGEESPIPSITIAENMKVTTTFDIGAVFEHAQLHTYDFCSQEPKPQTEIIINMMKDGHKFKLRAIANEVYWEAL